MRCSVSWNDVPIRFGQRYVTSDDTLVKRSSAGVSLSRGGYTGTGPAGRPLPVPYINVGLLACEGDPPEGLAFAHRLQIGRQIPEAYDHALAGLAFNDANPVAPARRLNGIAGPGGFQPSLRRLRVGRNVAGTRINPADSQISTSASGPGAASWQRQISPPTVMT